MSKTVYLRSLQQNAVFMFCSPTKQNDTAVNRQWSCQPYPIKNVLNSIITPPSPPKNQQMKFLLNQNLNILAYINIYFFNIMERKIQRKKKTHWLAREKELIKRVSRSVPSLF